MYIADTILRVALSVPIVVFLAFGSLAATPVLGAPSDEASHELLLTPTNEITEDPYFDWILKHRARGGPVETSKIEYLIERIRKSPYHFIRNRVQYSASEAAKYLTWKYEHGRKYIKTAHDFIHYLATRSLETGLLYVIKLPNGRTYPIRDLLENELHVLEQQLDKRTRASRSRKRWGDEK